MEGYKPQDFSFFHRSEKLVQHGINGLIVEVKSGKVAADELAERLAQLIDNPALREQMGEEGYKIFKEHFVIDRFEHAIKDALRMVIGGWE